jgi:sec-independent protein translocase protein TatC
MSFGDHLEELRGTLIRSLVGVGLGTVICLVFGKQILVFLCRPLYAVQQLNHLPMELQALAPTAAFVAYLKVAFLTGLIVSMPWVLYQLWSFVESGLYSHERRFVLRLGPVSVALFIIGVLFLYYIVLPIVLHFFVTFNRGFSVSDLRPNPLQRALLSPDPQPPDAQPPVVLPEGPGVPSVNEDPKDPPVGAMWLNQQAGQLRIRTADGVMSAEVRPVEAYSGVRSQFAIDFYVSFVLMLALAFGVAFELPVVIFFLALTGIMPPSTMSRYRRHAILAIVITAAILTPPDVISQVLLAIPMYVLFEIGLYFARSAERSHSRADKPASGVDA